jgi:hypothetical protein
VTISTDHLDAFSLSCAHTRPLPFPLSVWGSLKRGEAKAAEATVNAARKYFQYVVMPNYADYLQRPSEYHLLENALLLMNSMPERLALHQLGSSDPSREALYQEARKIRGQHSSLLDLQSCSNTLKHGRSTRGHRAGRFTTIATSTAIDPNDPNTWKVGHHDLVQVADRAFTTLNAIPELNAPST